MAYNYQTKVEGNHAKAVGVALPISRKRSVEICSTLRGMNVEKAKKLLENVIALKIPIAYKRYNSDVAHRAGMAAGRYPKETAREILSILKSAEANAQNIGLSASKLVIKHAVAQQGPQQMRFGRRRAKAKRTHIEIILTEAAEQPKKAKKTQKTEGAQA